MFHNEVFRPAFLWVGVAMLLIPQALFGGETETSSKQNLSRQDSAESQLIWSTPNAKTEAKTDPVFFRKVFRSDAKAKTTIQITADDGYRLYVNGRLVGSDKNWQTVERYDVSALIQQGENVIAIQAENATPGPAALHAIVKNQRKSGLQSISTDASWKNSAIPTPGWRFANFKDDAWKKSIPQGVYGKADPWGNQFQDDPSKTIVISVKPRKQRDGLELFDGDRIVFLGGTFVERMQTNEFVETMITTQFPNLNLTFRNLGWSGDNVFGLSRAVFGSQADGFRRLENDIKLAEPTLVLVCYGLNESFGGKEKLPDFLTGLSRLTEVLETTGTDLALVSPSLLENLGHPLPNPKDANARIRMYSDAIKKFAQAQGIPFVDNLKPLGNATVSKTDVPAIRDRLTDNGMHLNNYGYWRLAPHFAKKLGATPESCQFTFNVTNQVFSAVGSTIHSVQFAKDGISFSAKDDSLSFCPSPAHETPRGGKMMAIHDRLTIDGLPPGQYGLKINGQPSILATHERWKTGVLINRGDYLPQVEELRKEIQKKNELFFHRYRPQNETYLFLFRKHEQGNNAVEVPQFDPLIKEAESRIQKLKLPQVIQYQLQKIEVDPSRND